MIRALSAAAEAMTGRDPESPNVAVHLERMARAVPDHPAIQLPHPSARVEELTFSPVSFRELDADTSAVAHGLASTGIRRGTRVALLVPPSREFFALVFALYRIGAPPVLVDPGMGLRNLRDCLDRAAPEAMIGTAKAHIARRLFGWARRSLRTFVHVGTRTGRGPRLADLVDAGRRHGDYPAFVPSKDELAAVLFTSGSTGTPKGARYSHENFAAQVSMIRDAYGIEPGEIDVPTFPLFALFGPALGMGAVVPRMDFTRPGRVDPREIVRAVEVSRATNLFASPAVVRRLGEHCEEHDVTLPTLKRVISAGAPASPPQIARLARALRDGAHVHTPYGATESLPVSTIDSCELAECASGTDRGQGVCVGRPAEGIDVGIIEITDDPVARAADVRWLVPDVRAWTRAGRGESRVGEIVVRGPNVTRAYFRNDEGTALAKISDGNGFWHRMGDLGRVDAEGRLWMCGRKSQRVRTSEGDLYTIPTEGPFNAHPEVRRTAIVSGPDGPTLCVELEQSAKSKYASSSRRADLERALREIADGFPAGRRVEQVRFHPSFPVDVRHNSKIFREKLTEWVARGGGE